jgi:phosphate starvation-inducible PhoH-like protein
LEVSVELDPAHTHLDLFGAADSHLRLLRESLDVRISARGNSVVIAGEDTNVKKTVLIIDKMQKHLSKHHQLTPNDISSLITGGESALQPKAGGSIAVFSHKKVISPFTTGQEKYIKTMQENDLTFCTGPAGTGKTYLAVAIAVSMLKKKQIRRLVLARPAVEAGEKLGFLPGDLQAKVNPYLRPLFDALEDMRQNSQRGRYYM